MRGKKILGNKQEKTAKLLKNNIKEIYEDIKKISSPNQQVKLLAVSKKHSEEEILKAKKIGLLYFGESRVQEAEEKKEAYPKEGELHLIGHLQSNKINKALKLFDVIQTIDSKKLAEKVNKKAKSINKKQRIFCQINIGKDPNKTGFSEKELMKTVSTIINLSNIKLEGIMTILPLKKTQKERECLFLKTKKIRDHISKKHKTPLELSMGMSGDYRDAIACGSTLIRVGSKIFGTRA